MAGRDLIDNTISTSLNPSLSNSSIHSLFNCPISASTSASNSESVLSLKYSVREGSRAALRLLTSFNRARCSSKSSIRLTSRATLACLPLADIAACLRLLTLVMIPPMIQKGKHKTIRNPRITRNQVGEEKHVHSCSRFRPLFALRPGGQIGNRGVEVLLKVVGIIDVLKDVEPWGMPPKGNEIAALPKPLK